METNTACKILKADFESGAKNRGALYKTYWANVKDWGAVRWLAWLREGLPLRHQK